MYQERSRYYVSPGPRGGHIFYTFSPMHGFLPVLGWDTLAQVQDFIDALQTYHDQQWEETDSSPPTPIPDVFLKEFTNE